jgi:hypothetical protein
MTMLASRAKDRTEIELLIADDSRREKMSLRTGAVRADKSSLAGPS